MAERKETYIGNSKLKGSPENPIKIVIGENAVKSKHIADGAVTKGKLGNRSVEVKNLDDDVQNLIASMEKGGVALSGEFGDSEMIGINQKKLTEEIGPEGVITQKVATLEKAVGEGGSVDERIAVETNRAQAAEELLREYISLLQNQVAPKTAEEWAAMTSWEEGVIYRVAGTTSYTDYMYNGTTTIPMATYNNAIDNEPTAGSDNLVKSGGVYNSTPTIANSSAESDLDISDEDGNVLARFAGGHLQVKNFSSADALESIQAILSNIGFDNVPEFDEEADYAIGDIVRYEKYVYIFTSEHTAGEWDETDVEKTVINIEHPVDVADSENESDLDISDEEGNVLVRFENGHIRTKNFDSSKKGYLPRPSNGIINFSVNVDCYIADNNSNTLNNQDIPQNEQSTYIKQDWGVLMLPENYKQDAEAVYLVVCCHGTGTWISSDATQVNGRTDDMLLGMGFAIMDMNGCPDATSTSDRGYGTPPSLRAYLAGIHYVVQNYNIRKEIFVYGASMGGLASTFIAEVYPNVIAQGAFCPCLDIVREAYMTPWNGTTQKDRICTKFGFIGEKPTFSESRPISQEEKTYLINNIDKIIGYNNMWRNTIGLNFENCITVDAPSTVTSETSDEIALFNNAIKIRKAPLKIWHNTNDPLVPFKYSKYFVEMCRRGGCLVELRSFPSGGHNAWQNGEKINVTTKYKGTLEVYTSEYELLLWFLRFINN